MKGFVLEVTIDKDGWFTGQILEKPSVISQGKTFKELEANIFDALELVLEYEQEKETFIRNGQLFMAKYIANEPEGKIF